METSSAWGIQSTWWMSTVSVTASVSLGAVDVDVCRWVSQDRVGLEEKVGGR